MFAEGSRYPLNGSGYGGAVTGNGQMQSDLVIPFMATRTISAWPALSVRLQLHRQDAASADGSRLREGLVVRNTSSQVWADTAYRSAANE